MRRIAAIVLLFAVLAAIIFCMTLCRCSPMGEWDACLEIAHDTQTDSSTITVRGANEVVSMSEQMKAAEIAVRNIITPYGESVAVAVMPLDGTGGGFSINGDKAFTAASMIKLLVLAEYMREVDASDLDPADVYVLQTSDIVGGSGVVQEQSPGTPYAYAELARYMIKYSDNTATNILIDTMGKDLINLRSDDLGLTNTELRRRMMRVNEGEENYISANDAATLLCEIARHTLASEEICAIAESYLLEQSDPEGLAQGLPANVLFGHKTGSLSSVRHDGGIVYGENPYVVVVLTSLDEGTANALMSNISRAAYAALC